MKHMHTEKNEWYGFLIYFANDTTPDRSFLIRKSSEKTVDEAIRLGYIYQASTNAWGEPQYAITQLGRAFLD